MIYRIKYTSNLSFKYVHDLIMNDEGCIIEFEEIDDGVNPNSVFKIANLCQNYGKHKFKKLVFISPQDTLTDDVDPEIFFQGVPFDEVILNGKSFLFEV